MFKNTSVNGILLKKENPSLASMSSKSVDVKDLSSKTVSEKNLSRVKETVTKPRISTKDSVETFRMSQKAVLILSSYISTKGYNPTDVINMIQYMDEQYQKGKEIYRFFGAYVVGNSSIDDLETSMDTLIDDYHENTDDKNYGHVKQVQRYLKSQRFKDNHPDLPDDELNELSERLMDGYERTNKVSIYLAIKAAAFDRASSSEMATYYTLVNHLLSIIRRRKDAKTDIVATGTYRPSN